MKRLSTAIVLATAVLVPAAPAAAEVYVEGTGEPAHTKSANNTQWVRWTYPTGVDAYRLDVSWYRDNVLVRSQSVNAGGATGTMWIDWAGVATLEEGSSYKICVRGAYSFPNDPLYFPEGSDTCQSGAAQGKRTATVIDRTAPTISVALAGGAASAADSDIPVHVDFSDNLAGPHPANFVCVAAGAAPCDGLSILPACSVPNGPGRSTSFDCEVSASALADGPVTVCVIAADGAVPDNPSGADQTGQSIQANQSAKQCDTVLLDRAAPSVSITATPTSAVAGQPVAFVAEASDPTSGVAGVATWEWADGTAGTSANATTHIFAKAGTYLVRARVKDAAGNAAVAQRTVTVAAPATPGDPSDPSDPSDPANPADPADPGDPADPADPAEPAVPRLTLDVPRKVRLGRRARLVLGMSANRAGVVSVELLRRKRVLARSTRTIGEGATARRVRLPKRLRPGRLTLRVVFTAAGAADPQATTHRIRFVRRAR